MRACQKADVRVAWIQILPSALHLSPSMLTPPCSAFCVAALDSERRPEECFSWRWMFERRRLVVVGCRSLLSEPSRPHSGPSWARGANWLLIAGLHRGPFSTCRNRLFKGNWPNEIIYQSIGPVQTPNTQPHPHQPPATSTSTSTACGPAGLTGRPQVEVTWRKSSCCHHVIMGLHTVSLPQPRLCGGGLTSKPLNSAPPIRRSLPRSPEPTDGM